MIRQDWRIYLQRSNSWTQSRPKSSEFFSLLIKVTFTALPSDFYFCKLMQPVTVSTVSSCTVKEKGGEPDRKPHPFLCGLRSPYRNLKSENSQENVQKPQRNCTFMNTASGVQSADITGHAFPRLTCVMYAGQ
jgi:hypothetical protein